MSGAADKIADDGFEPGYVTATVHAACLETAGRVIFFQVFGSDAAHAMLC